MFFGVAIRGPLAIPLGIMLGLIWLMVETIRLALFLGMLALSALLPLIGAAGVGVLGRLDSRYVDRLETAEERHANGRERKQELVARSRLYSR